MARCFLRHNKSIASPGNLIFFDTETRGEPDDTFCNGELHTLRLGVASYLRIEAGRVTRRDHLNFRKGGQFWTWVLQKLHPRIPTWIFAHNLPFDLTVCGFWRLLESRTFVVTDPEQEAGGNQCEGRKGGWGKGFMILDDPPCVISGKMPGGGRVIFVDSLNYFLTSLAKMGDATGLPKIPMPDFAADDATWFEYCANDVAILEQAICGLIEFVKVEDLGRFRYTRAAQAMSAFRHRFKSRPIEFHDEPDVRNLERAAYYGGRLEACYLGRTMPPTAPEYNRRLSPVISERFEPAGPIYEYDVTSLYPHVMHSQDYPAKLVDSSFERQGLGDWQKILGGDCAAVVKLETPDPYPVRYPPIGTYWPIGSYWTALCGPELERAVRSSHVVDCAAWSRYHLAPLFEGFVDYFWEKRRTYMASGNTLYAELCKYLMNSLYGKFGQLSSEWVDRAGFEPPVAWGPWHVENKDSGEEHQYRVIGGHVQEKLPRGEIMHTSPAIAAWVTAWGREHIRDVAKEAGWQNTLYIVTDAVYVTPEGHNRLVAAGHIGDRVLGKLQLKYQSDECEIRGLHHLTLGTEVKHGSIKASAEKVGPVTFKETRFQHLASIIAGRENATGTIQMADRSGASTVSRVGPASGILIYPVEKTIALDYTRGVKLPSGWVAPLTLSDRRTCDEIRKSLCAAVPFSGVGPQHTPPR